VTGSPLPVLGTVRTGTLLAPTVQVRGQAAVLRRYRNRIDDEIVDHPFHEYWDIFVFKHQDRRNVLLHCLAVLMMYGSGLALRDHLESVVVSARAGFAGDRPEPATGCSSARMSTCATSSFPGARRAA
jgi:hypothetical protein